MTDEDLAKSLTDPEDVVACAIGTLAKLRELARLRGSLGDSPAIGRETAGATAVLAAVRPGLASLAEDGFIVAMELLELVDKESGPGGQKCSGG